MRFQELADGIVRANYHRGGIRLLKLFAAEPAAFGALREEVLSLSRASRFSRDTDPGHVSNWNGPSGDVRQFSLLNRSGNTADVSSDHDFSSLEKRFHRSTEYPRLARFMAFFPDSINFRIRIMGRGASLKPHEEHIVHWDPVRKSHFLRPRFHLPIKTNPHSETSLDGEVYHLEEGVVYYYNNGAVHSAANDGVEERVHLVWDSLLTTRVHEAVFGAGAAPDGFARLAGAAAIPAARRKEPVGDFIPSGPAPVWHKRLGLARLGVRPSQFARLYNWIDASIPRPIEPALPR